MVEQPIRRLLIRKAIHLAIGGLAFGLILGPWFAVLLTAALSVFNLWIWPRLGGRSLWRDPQGGTDVGIIAYPVVLLVLSLCFHHRLEVVAATWGILAFGDGMAAILGSSLGRRPLPWNPRKTWAGTLAYVLFGGLGATALLVWMTSVETTADYLFMLGVGGLAACLAAAVESLPLGLDDNWSAPPLAALLMWGLLSWKEAWQPAEIEALSQQAWIGGIVALGLALAAYAAKSVDLSGAVAGWLLATVITASLYIPGMVILGAFFVLGSVATKWGLARKRRLGLAQEAGGRRSARNALANAGAPAAMAVFAVVTPASESLVVAFVAGFAAATADTLSSEVGQLWGGRPVMITTWKPAPAGSDGGVTWVGSLAGLAGGGLVALLGWGVGLYGVTAVAWVLLASLVGNLLDSLLGATLENQGLLDNEAVNFASTLGASLVGLGLAAAGAAGA